MAASKSGGTCLEMDGLGLSVTLAGLDGLFALVEAFG